MIKLQAAGRSRAFATYAARTEFKRRPDDNEETVRTRMTGIPRQDRTDPADL